MRLLYVDDDDDIRLVGEMALAMDPGLEVRAAASGREALTIVADWTPDLCVLDMMMPGMDGLQLLAALRERGTAAPAVFMTAKGRALDREQYLAAGAVGVIVKPFDPLSLAADLRAILAAA